MYGDRRSSTSATLCQATSGIAPGAKRGIDPLPRAHVEQVASERAFNIDVTSERLWCSSISGTRLSCTAASVTS